MVLRVGPEPFSLSAYTNEDSDGNAMLKAHAYKAVTPGVVDVKITLSVEAWIKGYVGLTNDPVGAGTLIHYCSLEGGSLGFSLHLAKGEYFEITASTDTPVIHWKSFGSLIKPIDQD